MPCSSDDACPQSWSCLAGQCAPWPVGLVVPWAGSALPTGWQEADGRAVSRAGFGELFAAIGTRYGAGDGSTTFNLPDMRGRFALGQAQSGTGSVLGERFGKFDHGHPVVVPPHTHTLQVPAHSHAMDALPAHTHGWYFTLELNANPGPLPVLLKAQTGMTEPATGGPFNTSSASGASLTTSAEASVVTTQPANPPYLVTRWAVLAKHQNEPLCGALWHYGGAAPPAGARRADGAALSRSSQAWLYDCAQTTYGAGDGASTFNIPDLRGRSALGWDLAGGAAKPGASGGTLDHIHDALIEPVGHFLELPAHAHTAQEPAHQHAVVTPAPGYAIQSGYQFGCVTGLEATTGVSPGDAATSSIQPQTTVTVAAAAAASASSSAANSPFLALQPMLFTATPHRLPAGTISAFAGDKLPGGWLWADGSAVSRTAFGSLFAAIGTAFGPGDGATTFSVPDLRGRAALGMADSGPGSQLGASAGTLDHVHTVVVPNHQHHAVFPPHTHAFSFYSHVHTLGHTQVIATDDFAAVESARGVQVQLTGAGMSEATSKPAAAPGAQTSPSGGATIVTQPGNAPYLVLKYIIRT
jgi:microcystin-dependent protein